MKRLALSLALFAVTTLAAQTPAPLLQKTDLTYVGAFRLPTGSDTASYAYGGTALAFNAAHGSLFLVGHDWYQRVGEVSIPAPSASTSVSSLPRATSLQSPADPLGGKLSAINVSTSDSPKIGGVLPTADGLIVSAYIYYDGAGTGTLSHFRASQTLSNGAAVVGPFPTTQKPGTAGGWMLPIPAPWQAALGGPALTGQCCTPIISRSSYGPSVSVFDPADVGWKNPIPATMLLGYTATHPLAAWESTGQLFNGAVAMGGAVFPNGTRSVLFFGRVGLGAFCYGEGPTCGDPTDNSKGNHAYPYAYQVWAYDANDLAAVKAGTKAFYDVKPYATWQFDMPFENGGRVIKGAAYDPATGRIYLSIAYADGEQPLIQVLQVNGASNTPPPVVVPPPAPAPPPTPVPPPPAPVPVPPPPTPVPTVPACGPTVTVRAASSTSRTYTCTSVGGTVTVTYRATVNGNLALTVTAK